MKAIDYYKQFGSKFAEADTNEKALKVTKGLCCVMLKDEQEVLEKRNIKSDHAVDALIQEFNQKWNALCKLFEKDFGASPIKRDGWMLFMADLFSQVDNKLENKNE